MRERSYAGLVRRLAALGSANLRIETAGVVAGYPIFRVGLGNNQHAQKQVLICAGVHGDEPAGPEAALQFLERDNTGLLRHFTFTVFPCINPHGYAHNSRENREGLDVNRSFGEVGIAEVDLVKQSLKELRFDFAIDFHEDWEAKGFYLYEDQRDERWRAPEVIRRIKEIGSIDKESGENDLPIAEGAFRIDPDWGYAGLISYVYGFHTDHAILTETPTRWALTQRSAAHLAALDTLLEFYTNKVCRNGRTE